MDTLDLERLARLRATRGRAARQRGISLRTVAINLKHRSKGLTSRISPAGRGRMLDASADGSTVRDVFGSANRRVPRA